MLAVLCSFLFSPWTIVAALLIWMAYGWSTATFVFFDNKGVEYAKPFALLGNFAAIIARKQTFHDYVLSTYASTEQRYVGTWQFRAPLLCVRDPALIKQITVKDFDHFVNHRDFLFTEDVEPLMGKSLFMLCDQKWRDMRSTLSPAFTGSKMRLMFELIVECSQSSGEMLLAEARRHEAGGKTYVPELKEIFTRCMTDVIASTAFGLRINSLDDNDNQFFERSQRSTRFGLMDMMRGLFIKKYPRFARRLGINFFDPSHREFFRALVVDTMQQRDAHAIVRPDMIQLLMEARRGALREEADQMHEHETATEAMGFATVAESSGKQTGGNRKRVWTDDDFTAQCFLFFLAGFETSASLMCVAVHELMENRAIQERLMQEVDEVREELRQGDGGAKHITYERMQKMQYLDMVVSESLRKWPPVVATDRRCNKPYVIENTNGQPPYVVNVGDSIMLPIFGLHRDPNYFPDPERFDPERFSEQNRSNIDPLTYMPFGTGPRNCIASRFALMQVKAFLFHMLSTFTFEVAANTQIPLRLEQVGFGSRAIGGYNVHLKPRDL